MCRLPFPPPLTQLNFSALLEVIRRWQMTNLTCSHAFLMSYLDSVHVQAEALHVRTVWYYPLCSNSELNHLTVRGTAYCRMEVCSAPTHNISCHTGTWCMERLQMPVSERSLRLLKRSSGKNTPFQGQTASRRGELHPDANPTVEPHLY